MMKEKGHVPPVKSQGIKTKLVPWIKRMVRQPYTGRWIEHFMGTGFVAFNVRPQAAIMADTNPPPYRFLQGAAERRNYPSAGEALSTKGRCCPF